MAYNNLEESINSQPHPPCRNCFYYSICAEELLACRAFFQYTLPHNMVSTRIGVDGPFEVHFIRQESDAPTKEMYDRVFPQDDAPVYNTLMGSS